MWIEHATCADIDPRVGDRAVRGRHVVVQIAELDEPAFAAAIERLARAHPEHTVFRSGESTITILRVVDRAAVELHRPAIREAVELYRATCTALVDAYRAGTLDPAWEAVEHGFECRFTNHETGQLVEAPLEHPYVDRSGRDDPYFFARFVKSTPACRAIAALIEDDFHDAARMLDVLH